MGIELSKERLLGKVECNSNDSQYSNENAVKMKRKIKDSVFTLLFKDKKYVAELYSALHKGEYIFENDIDIITLSPVLIDDIYNDLGFLAEDKMIILVEAQTKWSYNIVFRMLMYYADSIKEYISRNHLDVHSYDAIPLPEPEFYVIYTGSGYKDIKKLSFADTYYNGSCDLDFHVHVLHDGNENDIVHQYVRFAQITDIVRKECKSLTDDAEVREIIKRCMSEGVLVEFLSRHEQEVISIMDDEREFLRYIEAREAKGKAEGKAECKAELIMTMREQGLSVEQISMYTKCSINEIQELLSLAKREE